MKLTYFQLEPHLLKTLAPLYIVSGEDILLKQDARKLIRKTAERAGFTAHTRLTKEAGFDWEQLYTTLYSTSLLTHKQLFELDFCDTLPTKTASQILTDYGKNLPADNLLLIDIGKIDNKIAKSTWYQSLEKRGIVVTIWPLSREQLPRWIAERAKKYKLQFSDVAILTLANYVEGNLVAAAHAIEKIYLLQPQKTIDAALIESLLIDESHFTVFDFVEQLIAQNRTRALRILATLKAEGTEPTLILWAITRELRLLADLAEQRQLGTTLEQLFQKNRVFSNRQPAIRHFLTKFSVQDCWSYLLHAAEIDQIIKGSAPYQVWDALQLFCLRLV